MIVNLRTNHYNAKDMWYKSVADWGGMSQQERNQLYEEFVKDMKKRINSLLDER